MKNLKIRHRLFIAFTLIVLLLALAVSSTLIQLRTVKEDTHRIVNLRVPTALASSNMSKNIYASIASLRGWILTGDQLFKSERASIWENISLTSEKMDSLSQNWTNPDNIKQWDKFKQLLKLFSTAQNKLEGIALQINEQPIIYKELDKEATQLADQLLAVLLGELQVSGVTTEGMVKNQRSLLEVDARHDAEIIDELSITQWLLLLAGLLLGTTLSLVISRFIASPIVHITEVMKRLANGDLNAKVPSQKHSDEIGDMFSAVQVFKQNAVDRVLLEKAQKATMRELDFQKYALDQHAIVSITDVKGNITYVNDKFCNISGYTEDELVGKNHRLLKSNEHSIELFKEMWRTIANGNVWHGEIKNITKDGSYYWVNSTIVPFLNTDKKPFQYVSIRTEITQQKDMETDLLSTRNEAEKASRSKGDFLANMSHEIRTPMNAVIGLSHLALQTDLDEKQHDYLSKILSSSNSLLRIINDILDFSKIEAGKLSMEEVTFKLDAVIEQICSVSAHKANEKGIEIYIAPFPKCTNNLIGDPLRLSQILLNLINNAIKFTDEGEIVIIVSEVSRKAGNLQLNFEVKDTGIGLSEKAKSILFNSFSQADTSTTRKYGGTGLGLAISKQLVELMDGKIGVESEVDKGSTFHFTANFKITNESTNLDTPEQDELKGLKALVADDKAVARDILVRILGDLQLEASSVDSGEAALIELKRASLNKQAYDYAIIDWKMSGIDGIEVAEKVATIDEIYPKPKIIIATAYSRDEALEQINVAEPFEVLAKPVRSSTMLEALRKTAGKRQSNSVRVTDTNSINKDTNYEILGAHILVVEDTPINQQVAQELLENIGMITTIANDGLEALKAIQEQSFDAILMDIQMPKMDGIEATQEIRKMPQFKHLPIIAMTAHAMPKEKARCLQVGMNDHISKPFNPEVLYDTLSNWINPSQRKIRTKPVNKKVTSLIALPSKVEGINIKLGLTRVAGNHQLYLKILTQFYDSHCNSFNKLKKELTRQDLTPALRRVHTIKGLAGLIGAELLAEKTRHLEITLQSESNSTKTIADPLSNFNVEMSRVLESIKMMKHSDNNQQFNSISKQIDIKAVQSLFERLSKLIGDADLDSIQLAQELAEHLASHPYKKMLNTLIKHLNQFDFVVATTLLAKIDKLLIKNVKEYTDD